MAACGANGCLTSLWANRRCGVSKLGFGFSVPGIENPVSGIGFPVPGIENSVPGIENSVPGIGFSVPGIENSIPGIVKAGRAV